ncbi:MULTISPECIES: ATP synthase F1 subunit gamma [Thermodesulfobacterium]|jgi:F-type H+-transporting ATPase subunit gamma|uniref:ATP synthase gamma chain n=1 Tax=Thermodesulfobacterium commune DSM 2178 TaxID=289377 RepID=A0A075WQB9_9BACT|nr:MULTISPECIES: ATP synthase F1 subunit gamma [Thermodesulfobacterium]KUJ97502.1 MAG: ATP synthase gamma chain [Thermodesulfobacterium sp. 37_54]KUK19365.1 MAG: ATP synthase gamma chain [Thermodesulfobacterium commune]AIH03534.1 ATP F0F1 synthase subunit gamma [Thermodesulfobacterium commune DSM 2178]MBZ4681002.1 synthase subunit gamma [Thermodesulfobacterium sp.]MDN5378997.1 F-type H+-transporting ATPase subunit gamma [Thermodesulfobacterium sp.]
MPNLRDIRKKIDAVKKIGQITKAMNMVASAKLRSIQRRLEGFRPYKNKFEEVITNLISSGGINPQKIELLQVREVKKVGIILVTADRGLCGAFNSMLIKETEKMLAKFKKEGKEVELICVGKKGANYFAKRAPIKEAYTDVMGKVLIQDARKIARSAMRAFLNGEWDEVYVVYGYFVNLIKQIPKVEKLLPLSFEPKEAEEKPKVSYSYIYEPEEEELLPEILPLYVNTVVFAAMLETAVSEQAARMTAMDNANRACGDMVRQLTLLFNKTRQASITKELMDIVGGAEAIKKG